MPALSPVQQQLIDIFASQEDFVKLAFITNHGDLPNQEFFKSLCNNLREITLGNPKTAQRLLQAFNPQDLDLFINSPTLSSSQSTAPTEILKKIKTAIEQGKKQNQALVPATGNQAKAIDMLWASDFLNICFEIFNQNHTFSSPVPQTLINKYTHYIQRLHTIALGATSEQEIAFLTETHSIAFDFLEYLRQLSDTTGSYYKWRPFFTLLNFYFKHPSLISRFVGASTTLLIAPFLMILFLNPVKLFLLSIAKREYLLGLLSTGFYPIYLPLNVFYATLFGYTDGFGLTFKHFASLIQKDFRYTLLSFLIIGLGVASALTLVFFPPAVPFLLSFPYLSALSSISLPWLAVIAGTTVGLLATSITASITWFITRKSTSPFSAVDDQNNEVAPLIAATNHGQNPEAQAALAVKNSSPFKTLPNVIEVTTQSEKIPALQSTIYKNKGARYPEYPFYIVYDDHHIYITCSSKECTTGKIKFSFLCEPIVVENGQCKTALPPYIKFIPDQYQGEFTDLVIRVNGHPHANKTLYKGQPFTYGPFKIFNDGETNSPRVH